jgi:diguanylate cyclase (GGDEF)-like protein
VTGAARRTVLRVALLGLAGLCATVPFSHSDSVHQPDNLVLAAVAGWAAWWIGRRTRHMRPSTRRPWQVLASSATLFCLASLLTGTGVGGAFGDLGLGDALLVVAALGPTATAAMLADRNAGTRWPVLALDGVMVTVSLVFVADVLVLSPALAPGVLDAALTPVVVGYGLYPAVAVGLAGALCTVSAAARRRSATAVLLMTVLTGLGSAMLAVTVVQPGRTWAGLLDVVVLLAVLTGVLAVELAPADVAVTGPSTVNVVGVAISLGALFGVPATLTVALLTGLPINGTAVACCAAVTALLVLRLLDRIRVSGRIREDLVRSEQDFRGLVEASSDGVAIVDADLRLEFTSPAARSLLGLPDSDPHPLLLDLLHEEDRPRVRLELTAAVGEVAPTLQLRVAGPGGEPRELEVTHHERPGSGRRVLHLRDVTTRRRRERELERMAFTDHLTRLPNRALLFQEMATPSPADRCLLVLDLDGFKAVNDTAGHECGDLLLVEVARRLQGLLRTDDLVARLGGDEFAVLVAGAEEAAVEAAQRVVDVLGQPYRVGGRTFSVGASVGLCPVHTGGGQLAFRQADTALRAAKQAGKGCWRVHDDDRVAQAAATSDVAAALAAGQVQLRYDVVATSGTGEIAGVHATPVWVHPELGVLPAPELWAAAERRGQNRALQQWLLRQTCTEVMALDRELQVGFDLPAGQVHADELAGEVTAALAGAGMAPRQLVLAFDEEVLQTSSAGLIPALHVIRAMGVHLCLDDFGMGSTLWSQLARVPLDTVRVDVHRLAAPGDHERTMKVLTAIESSAAAFDVYTLASGVGSPELYDAIRAQCRMAVTGPVLPTGLTGDQVASLLRHPSATVLASVALRRPRAGV